MCTPHQENNTGKVKDMTQQLRVLVAESGGAVWIPTAMGQAGVLPIPVAQTLPRRKRWRVTEDTQHPLRPLQVHIAVRTLMQVLNKQPKTPGNQTEHGCGSEWMFITDTSAAMSRTQGD